jgi:para-nitrobenzyl esterase
MYFWARNRLPQTKYPIYAYLWTHIEPGPDSARYLAFHSSEIPYVFDTLDTAKRPFTALDRKLAVELGTYWLNFVKTGNPNGGSQPQWPPLTATDKQILEIGDTTRVRPVLPPDRLALFDLYTKAGGQLSIF